MIVCQNFRKKKIVAVLNYINITLGGGIKMQLIYFAKREFVQRLKTHVLLTNLAAFESVQLCSREKMTPFLLSDQLSPCNSTGVTVPQASLRFGHPHYQNPSDMDISQTYSFSDFMMTRKPSHLSQIGYHGFVISTIRFRKQYVFAG